MKIKLVDLIVYLIYFYLPIDTLNGVLIRNMEFSVSPYYKSLILSLILIYLTRKKILYPLKWSIFFLIFFIFHYFLGTFSSIEFFWGLKFLAIVFSFYFFKDLFLNKRLEIIIKLAFISFWLIAINILIGLSGFGFSQYAHNEIGTRGLFYAGNELGILLLITSIILLSNFLIKKDIKKFLLFSLIFMFFGAMLTSKTAVLGQVLVVFSLPIINLNNTRKGLVLTKSSLKLMSFGFFVVFLGLPYLIYFVLFKMNLIARLSYWMGKVDKLTLFFSGRNLLAEDVYKYLKTHNTFFNNLIGYGYDNLMVAAGRSVEIDFVDLFMLFGLIGIIGMYGFFVEQLRKGSYLKSKNNVIKPYITFGIYLLLALSCLSGHVLNSGMAGMVIGAFLALQYYKSSETYE